MSPVEGGVLILVTLTVGLLVDQMLVLLQRVIK